MNIKNHITNMEIDEKIVNFSNKYIFKNIRNHATYMRINLTDLNSIEFMFCKISNLISIKFSKEFDTMNITSMKRFFYRYDNLKSFDINNLSTENVEDISNMFSHCLTLNAINLS